MGGGECGTHSHQPGEPREEGSRDLKNRVQEGADRPGTVVPGGDDVVERVADCWVGQVDYLDAPVGGEVRKGDRNQGELHPGRQVRQFRATSQRTERGIPNDRRGLTATRGVQIEEMGSAGQFCALETRRRI
jgi:hypothetical protein